MCGDVAQAQQFVPDSLGRFIRERVNASICSTNPDPTSGVTPDTNFDVGMQAPESTAPATSPTWSWCWAGRAELEAHGYDWSARLEDRCATLCGMLCFDVRSKCPHVECALTSCFMMVAAQEQVFPRQRHVL